MYSCFVTFQFCYYSQLLPIPRILSAIKIPKTIDYRVGKNEETVANIDYRNYRIRSNFQMKIFTKISNIFENIFSYNLIMTFNYHNDIDSKMENYPSKLHNTLIFVLYNSRRIMST